MKKNVKLICLIALLFGSITLKGGEIGACEPNVSDSVDFSLVGEQCHPRLFMHEEDFTLLKKKLKRDKAGETILSVANSIAMNLADERLASDLLPEYVLDPSGIRLLPQCQLELKRLFSFCYAYRVTGEAKYLDQALSDLRNVCSFPDWHPVHFLDVAEMSLAVAVAYDWLYDELSDEDKTLVSNALIEYGLRPSLSQWFHRAKNNWNQVCNCCMVAAALAVYELNPELCGKVLNAAIVDNKAANNEIYSPDGIYPEGYLYWGYGTGFETMLISLLEKAVGNRFGLDETPGFIQTSEYMLFMAGACGNTFSYADGGITDESPKLGMWWFAAKQENPALLLNELRRFEAGNYEFVNDGYSENRFSQSDERRFIPALACWLCGSSIGDMKLSEVKASKPSKEVFYGQGPVPLAIIHTNWNFDESDVYLGVKAGPAGISHGHMDAGSFVYDAFGVRWVDDVQRVKYALVESELQKVGGKFFDMSQLSYRWDVFRLNNLDHSTLSFFNSDGSGGDKFHVSDYLVKGAASLEEVCDTPGEYMVKVDITPAVADQVASAVRTFKLVGKELHIIDEVTAKPGMDAIMQWRAFTATSANVNSECIKLEKDGKSLLIKTSNDAALPIEYSSWQAARPDDWEARTENWDPDDSNCCIVGFSATIPAGSGAVFTTILSPAD